MEKALKKDFGYFEGFEDYENYEDYESYEESSFEDRFENYRKNIVTTIAYLIGVSDECFSYVDRFDLEEYAKLKKNESATIIRCLCRLRTQFLKNYKNIDNASKYEMRPLDSMVDYVDVDAIKYLRQRGIEISVVNAKSPSVNIAYINQYILDNIDKIKSLIPDWIKFQYVKSLFLVPGGYAGHNGANIRNDYKKIFKVILDVGHTYAAQRFSYPYQMYINWPGMLKVNYGNILFNDLKFLKSLYSANKDKFQAYGYVVDAKEETKEEIYDFLEDANNVAIFVDCENVDPYSFGATILNLDEEELSKIKKIVLYDDVNASTAWDYIASVVNIPVVKKDVERVLDYKSLVDITMTAGVCEEYYRNNMESIILASSDSDFWGLIKQMPGARFLVLNEFTKTSCAVIDQLDKNGILHCYMSDFAQDSIQEFKSDVLYLGLAQHIKNFNATGEFGTLDVDELLLKLFRAANIRGAESQVEKEKEAFFNKYLKNGLLLKPTMENGKNVLKIEIYKK